MYLIQNGVLILEDRVASDCDLVIAGDRIIRIARQGDIEPEGFTVIDAHGGYVAPGFICLLYTSPSPRDS